MVILISGTYVKEFFKIIFFLFSLLFLIACGVKGPPLQPVAKILLPVENVKIYQKGKVLIASITFPENYSDNTPLKIKKIRVYYNFYPSKERVEIKEFLKKSFFEDIEFKEEKGIIFRKETGSFPQIFKSLIYYWDSGGKKSIPSKLFEFEVEEPPEPPENITADVRESGIHLKWKFKEIKKNIGFFVYIYDGKDFKKLNQEPLVKNEFVFKDFTWDVEHHFKVSSVSEKLYESDDSEEISIIPVDKFPPPPPQNLIAIPEEGFILLKWEKVEVGDFEKYNVYRRENGKEELLTLNGTKETSFEDRKGEKGKIYKYFVTAVDKKGNESGSSNLVEERYR